MLLPFSRKRVSARLFLAYAGIGRNADRGVRARARCRPSCSFLSNDSLGLIFYTLPLNEFAHELSYDL